MRPKLREYSQQSNSGLSILNAYVNLNAQEKPPSLSVHEVVQNVVILTSKKGKIISKK